MSNGRPSMSLADFQQLPRYTRYAMALGPRNAALVKAKDLAAGSRTVARLTEGERNDLRNAMRVKLTDA